MKNEILATLVSLAACSIAGCAGSTSAEPPYGYGQSSAPAAAGSPAAPAAPAGSSTVMLATTSTFDAFLGDGAGRALYFFANDVPGSNSSACTAACLEKWPAYDAKELTVDTGLLATDFTRFQRPDGVWQTSFKGRPLYTFAMDAAGSVSGDGAAGRWYVARDYAAFVATKADLTPQGSAMPAPYMTNRAGRTVYVLMNDTAGATPTSACAGACLDAWPVWSAPAALDAMALPSSMKLSDFGQFDRTVAGATVKQLTYRGFPLYFHTPDAAAGTTTGHMNGAWRAIDPAGFQIAK